MLESNVVSQESTVERQPSTLPTQSSTADSGLSTVDLKLARRRRSWIALASGVWLAPALKRGGTNVA
jgi:hypothetical protein